MRYKLIWYATTLGPTVTTKQETKALYCHGNMSLLSLDLSGNTITSGAKFLEAIDYQTSFRSTSQEEGKVAPATQLLQLRLSVRHPLCFLCSPIQRNSGLNDDVITSVRVRSKHH